MLDIFDLIVSIVQIGLNIAIIVLIIAKFKKDKEKEEPKADDI